MKGVVGVDTHLYIIFINKLYSGIFILPLILRHSMFVYLNWKNKNGDDLKTLLEETKAKDIADQMEALGIEVRLSPEAPITYIK